MSSSSFFFYLLELFALPYDVSNSFQGFFVLFPDIVGQHVSMPKPRLQISKTVACLCITKAKLQ